MQIIVFVSKQWFFSYSYGYIFSLNQSVASLAAIIYFHFLNVECLAKSEACKHLVLFTINIKLQGNKVWMATGYHHDVLCDIASYKW